VYKPPLYQANSKEYSLQYIAACTGNLPECVLHVCRSDTPAGDRSDAERAADPRAAGVETSLTT